MDHNLDAEPAHINLSPVAFRLWAKQYYQCGHSFPCSDFSPVPYFLFCRAIELHFKAIHLDQLKTTPPGHQTQADVKNLYQHDLIKSYWGLPAANQTLSNGELSLLETANKVYSGKGFEYVNVHDSARGFSNFPDLLALDALAKAIVGR